MKSHASTPVSRILDFTRTNPPIFHGIKVDEDPQGFIDEVFKVVHCMGVTSKEKVELASYQLKDIAQVLFDQWRDERLVRAVQVDWGVFKTTFLDRFSPHRV